MTDLSLGSPGGPDHPRISIVVPVHNREDLLQTCLASVKNQRIDIPIEVIVVDDHSDDDSARVAQDSGATVIVLPENLGPGEARNCGIAAARGEWIAFLDSDDLWHPEHLRTLWDHRHGVALVSTSGLTSGGSKHRVHGSPYLHTLELRKGSDILRPENIINTSAVMLKTTVLRDIGGFSPSRFSEDLDLWLRILATERGRALPQLTVVNREHAGRVTRTHRSGMSKGTSEVMTTATNNQWISESLRKRVEVTAQWDDWCAANPKRLRGLRTLAKVGDRRSLLELWWHRAKLRHRWRIQHSRVAELLTLADGSHDRMTNPVIGL